MIRRNKVVKKKTNIASAEVKKAKKPNVVVTPQFFYLKNCSHDLKGKSCAMCKLIEKETAAWIMDEKTKSNLIKMQNFYRRAEMRYGLLRDWSKNQLSANHDLIVYHSAEIIMCTAAVEALSHAENIEQDLKDLEKNLHKRIRIQEVGDYAATYIQCRLRGMSCRRRVKEFMLRRFEYFPETNRRTAYFLDKRRGDRWHTTPHIISDVRPSTPRTIQRRITSQNAVREKRLEAYRRFEKDPEYTGTLGGGIWKNLEMNMQSMRQLAILRDVLHSVMKALATKRRNTSERPAVRMIPNPDAKSLLAAQAAGTSGKEDDQENESRRSGSGVESRSTSVRSRGSRGRGRSDAAPQIPLEIEQIAFPFWFTLSNPAPPTRQIYISLALETEPLQPEHVVALTPEEEKAKKEAEAARAALVATGQFQEEEMSSDDMDINHRLQLLERRAWEQMMCMDADEMIIKIAKCEELGPALSSCAQIADDEHSIWTGKLYNNDDDEGSVASLEEGAAITPHHQERFRAPSKIIAADRKLSAMTKLPSISSDEDGVSRQASVDAEDDIRFDEGQLIPCQLCIHPFFANRSPAGMFRLFFIDGMCLGVCHASPWVYYSEVWKYRGSVVKSLYTFSQSTKVTNLVNMLMARANAETEQFAPLVGRGTSRTTSGGSTTGTASIASNPLLHTPTGSCMTLVLPDERAIFGNKPEMKPSELTGEEYIRIGQKYRFLRKMHSWKQYKRKTLKNFKRPDAADAEEEVPLPASSENEPVDVPRSKTLVKLQDIPPPDTLIGTKPYELSCLQVPQASLNPKTRQISSLFPGSKAYRDILQLAVNEGEENIASMHNKFCPPCGNEYTVDLVSEIPPPPNYNLVILDVHMGFPAAAPEVTAAVAATGTAARRQSKASAAPQKPSIIPLAVDIQQVVGVFAANSVRPPAAVDTSLFSWDEIRKYALKAANLRNIMATLNGVPGGESGADDDSVGDEGIEVPLAAVTASATAFETPKLPAPKITDDSLHWECKITKTGVFSAKLPLQSGNSMQIRIVGRKPAREYLEEVVPRKLRLWMGLKY